MIGTDNVTLSMVKKHLNISFIEDDDYLDSLIEVSLSAVENYCRNVFIHRSNVQNIGSFYSGLPVLLKTDITDIPSDGFVTIDYIFSTVPMTINIQEQDMYTSSGNSFVYENTIITIYLLDVITPDDGTDVTLTWNTGQETMDDAIVQARLLLIGNYYENRESVATGITVNELPNGMQYLLEPYLYLQVG